MDAVAATDGAAGAARFIYLSARLHPHKDSTRTGTRIFFRTQSMRTSKESNHSASPAAASAVRTAVRKANVTAEATAAAAGRRRRQQRRRRQGAVQAVCSLCSRGSICRAVQVNDGCNDSRAGCSGGGCSTHDSVNGGRALVAAEAAAQEATVAATAVTWVSSAKLIGAKVCFDFMRLTALVASQETILQNLHLHRLFSFGAEDGTAANTAAATDGVTGCTECCRYGA